MLCRRSGDGDTHHTYHVAKLSRGGLNGIIKIARQQDVAWLCRVWLKVSNAGVQPKFIDDPVVSGLCDGEVTVGSGREKCIANSLLNAFVRTATIQDEWRRGDVSVFFCAQKCSVEFGDALFEFNIHVGSGGR